MPKPAEQFALFERGTAGGIAGPLDVLPEQPDVTAELRFGVVDLRALPQPGLAARSPSASRQDEQDQCDRKEDEREPHADLISAAAPNMPTIRGTMSRTLSRAQNSMSSSSPGGP
jgi:hypothetical protein